jgi:hypothetical protein
VIENQTFRLVAGADEAAFRADDARVQQDVAYRQTGLVRRTTARATDGEWLVSTIWHSDEHADAAAPVLDALLAHIDAATIRTQRYRELD